MTKRFPTSRCATVLAGLTAAGALGGCASMSSFFSGGSSHTVSFTNVSDTALDVSFFVETTGDESMVAGGFTTDGSFQVARGETEKYKLTKNKNYKADTGAIVHLHVEPVGPSWQPTGAEYWLEVLTHPPITVVATGEADNLSFNAGTGEIALIPASEIEGRFEHQVVNAPESDQPEQ